MGGGRRGGGGHRSGSSMAGGIRTAAPPTRRASRGPASRGSRAGGGPGMLGVAGAAMFGALAGNALARHLFATGAQPASEADVQEMKKVMDESPCATQFDLYAKCMEANNNNVEACNWTWDYVAKCRVDTMRALEDHEAQRDKPSIF